MPGLIAIAEKALFSTPAVTAQVDQVAQHGLILRAIAQLLEQGIVLDQVGQLRVSIDRLAEQYNCPPEELPPELIFTC